MMLLRVFITSIIFIFVECEKDCKLNMLSPFAYMVKLNTKNVVIAHGSLLCMKAVLTVCSNFDVQGSTSKGQYTATAGKVRNLRDTSKFLETLCYQERTVLHIDCHPKALTADSLHGFDWAVAVLEKPFDIDHNSDYPTIRLPHLPDELFEFVRYGDRLNFEYCDIPIFEAVDNVKPVVTWKSYGFVIPFAECIEQYCRGKKDGAKCAAYYHSIIDSSLHVCFFEGDYKTLNPHEGDLKWYRGVPLVCKGLSYGIGTDIKNGKENGINLEYDFFFFTTYLRVWNFIIDAREKYGAVIPQIFIEQNDMPIEKIERPLKAVDGDVIEVTIPDYYESYRTMKWMNEEENRKMPLANDCSNRNLSHKIIVITILLTKLLVGLV